MAKNIKRNKPAKTLQGKKLKERPERLAKKLRQDMLIEFERFVEYHPVRRFSQNLRSLFLEFLMYDGSAEAEYLRELAVDLTGFFDLLDAIELMQRNNHPLEDYE